jgi:hypothetical protein
MIERNELRGHYINLPFPWMYNEMKTTARSVRDNLKGPTTKGADLLTPAVTDVWKMVGTGITDDSHTPRMATTRHM